MYTIIYMKSHWFKFIYTVNVFLENESVKAAVLKLLFFQLHVGMGKWSVGMTEL